jgi:hypothetical protein
MRILLYILCLFALSCDNDDANAANLSECNNPQYDLEYLGEFTIDDVEYGIFNVFGNQEIGICSWPPEE